MDVLDSLQSHLSKIVDIPISNGPLSTKCAEFRRKSISFSPEPANSFYAINKIVMAALEQQKVYIYWDLRVLFCTQAGVPQTVLLIPIEYSQLNLVHMCLLGTSPMNPHISIYGVVLDVKRTSPFFKRT